MAVRFHREGIEFELKEKRRHKRWIKEALEAHQKIPGEINFIFTGNEQLRLINREYLNHNYFTDVITFDNTQGKLVAGDIFISIDQVKRNAVEYQCDWEEELRRVMIHGVLHMLGYKDKMAADERLMREKENDALHLWLKLV